MPVRSLGFRGGQAMLEAVLAVLIVSSVFLVLFKLSHMLTGKILLEHAAMRVARARSVGFNDFMCRKAARVSVIPVAGERIWPTGADTIGWDEELARVSSYLQTWNEPEARGVLEYEHWGQLGVDAGDGTKSTISLKTDWFDLTGQAGVEANSTYYLLEEGL